MFLPSNTFCPSTAGRAALRRSTRRRVAPVRMSPPSLVFGVTRPQRCLPCLGRHWSHMPPELRAVAEGPEGQQYAPRWQVPHRSGALTCLFLIVLPAIIFLAFVAPTLAHDVSVSVPIISSMMLLLSSLFMGLTSFTDPGMLPPATSADYRESLRRAGPQKLLINGFEVTTKFCHVCGIQRPPRASHCRETNRCIERWDHYCPWVGTAVGRRNYRWFLLFVAATAGLAICVASFSILHLARIGEALKGGLLPGQPPPWRYGIRAGDDVPTWLRAIAAAPLSCALTIYALVVTTLLCLLLSYHIYLLAINQTTYENMRGTYDLSPNPFNEGLLRNVMQTCCVRPSLWPLVLESTDLESGSCVSSLRGGGVDGVEAGSSASSSAASRALQALEAQEKSRMRAFIESEGVQMTAAMIDSEADRPTLDMDTSPPRGEPPPSPEAEPWDAHDSASSVDSSNPLERNAIFEEVILVASGEDASQGDARELPERACENTAFV